MAEYRFDIRKADHINANGDADFHVHVYFTKNKKERLLGRYRLPLLSPIFPSEPELNDKEISFLREWLALEKQQKKLQDALKSTLFNLSQAMKELASMSKITLDDQGDTYLVVKIPVSKRLE